MLATGGAVDAGRVMTMDFLYLTWLIAGRAKLNARAEVSLVPTPISTPAAQPGNPFTGAETVEQAYDKLRLVSRKLEGGSRGV